MQEKERDENNVAQQDDQLQQANQPQQENQPQALTVSEKFDNDAANIFKYTSFFLGLYSAGIFGGKVVPGFGLNAILYTLTTVAFFAAILLALRVSDPKSYLVATDPMELIEKKEKQLRASYTALIIGAIFLVASVFVYTSHFS